MDELLTLWIRGYPEGDPLCGWYWYWGGGEGGGGNVYGCGRETVPTYVRKIYTITSFNTHTHAHIKYTHIKYTHTYTCMHTHMPK